MLKPDQTTSHFSDLSNGSVFQDSELHSAQGLMHRDKPLTPKMISSLLNVEVTLPSAYAHEAIDRERASRYSFSYIAGVLLLSCICALIIGRLLFFMHDVDPLLGTRVAPVVAEE